MESIFLSVLISLAFNACTPVTLSPFDHQSVYRRVLRFISTFFFLQGSGQRTIPLQNDVCSNPERTLILQPQEKMLNA